MAKFPHCALNSTRSKCINTCFFPTFFREITNPAKTILKNSATSDLSLGIGRIHPQGKFIPRDISDFFFYLHGRIEHSCLVFTNHGYNRKTCIFKKYKCVKKCLFFLKKNPFFKADFKRATISVNRVKLISRNFSFFVKSTFFTYRFEYLTAFQFEPLLWRCSPKKSKKKVSKHPMYKNFFFRFGSLYPHQKQAKTRKKGLMKQTGVLFIICFSISSEQKQ